MAQSDLIVVGIDVSKDKVDSRIRSLSSPDGGGQHGRKGGVS